MSEVVEIRNPPGAVLDVVFIPIPDMPELDDVFAEALQRVYRFGTPAEPMRRSLRHR